MRRTVLIVEDAELCRDALEIVVAAIPEVSVRMVGTAEEALRELSQQNISALVTDLNLPTMDGFELIQKVRSQPGRAALPIVVISGDSDPRTPARVTRLGADAYFTKPYSPLEVRGELERLLDAN